jgi:hypothetical protein
MAGSGDGGPAVGPSARALGARLRTDIPVVSGSVHPASGGISVAPDDPHNLVSFRRPPDFGGSGRDPVWSISSADLGPDLQYRPDPEDPARHGFIEPARSMSFDDYQAALGETRWQWQRISPLAGRSSRSSRP